jgi:hypothetical protein
MDSKSKVLTASGRAASLDTRPFPYRYLFDATGIHISLSISIRCKIYNTKISKFLIDR